MTSDDLEHLNKYTETTSEPDRIMVVGVGGGGGNAVNHMYNEAVIHGVSFVVVNTDDMALKCSPVPRKLLIGPTVTRGRGAGNVPERAREAAEESAEDIRALFTDETDMVFITAGMGGGTGTGAAPVVARIARERGLLTIGIVTIPFLFEGMKKIAKAVAGAEEMGKYVDALLVINNERLRDVYSDLSVINAFGKADDTLSIAAKSIAEIITLRGTINLDFNDVRTVLKDGGVAIMSTGYGEGEGRVTQAINDALHSPLLNNNDIFNSKKVLFVITYNPASELMMNEMDEIHEFMSHFGKEVETKWGLYSDETLEQKVKFTILATGFGIKDVPGMDNVIKKRTAEEQKKLEELEELEQKKDERRSEYYGSQINGRSNRKRRHNLYIFTQEDLDNDDVISMVETTPTFQRSKAVLEGIQSRAFMEEPASSTGKTDTGGTSTMTISF